MKVFLSSVNKYLILILSLVILILSINTSTPYSFQEENDDEIAKKIVYLTFDDGPSKNTTYILDILKENEVKATFFIISPYIPSHNEIVKRIYDEGHALGNHTADHEFNKVYTSEDIFIRNFNKQQEFIKNITGSDCTIFRFPGGSKNTLVRNAHGKDFTKNLISKLELEGIHCYDWNVDSGDASGNNVPSNVILNNVIKALKDKEGNNKNPAIVLMHDCLTKKTTVAALPSIIKFFKDEGYEFNILQ